MNQEIKGRRRVWVPLGALLLHAGALCLGPAETFKDRRGAL